MQATVKIKTNGKGEANGKIHVSVPEQPGVGLCAAVQRSDGCFQVKLAQFALRRGCSRNWNPFPIKAQSHLERSCISSWSRLPSSPEPRAAENTVAAHPGSLRPALQAEASAHRRAEQGRCGRACPRPGEGARGIGKDPLTSRSSRTIPGLERHEHRHGQRTKRFTKGANWTPLGTSQTVTMVPSVYVRLAVSNRTTSSLATSTFDNVSLASP